LKRKQIKIKTNYKTR